MASVSNRTQRSSQEKFKDKLAGHSREQSREKTGESARKDSNPRQSKVSARGGLPGFLEGYEHIKIQDACEEGPIGPDDLSVWVNRTGEWTQLDVHRLWGKRRGDESLCRRLVTGLLGLSAKQYESMKDAFEDPDGSERIGIYRNDEMKYVIVVRMPADNKALLGASAAAIGVGSAALGFFSRGGVSVTTEAKWVDAVDNFIRDVNLFSALYGLERDVLLNPENPYYEEKGREGEKTNLRAFQKNLDALQRAMFDYKSKAPNSLQPELIPSKIQQLVANVHERRNNIIQSARNQNKEDLTKISHNLENVFIEIQRLKWFEPINAPDEESGVYGFKKPPDDIEARKLSQLRLYLFAQLLSSTDKLFEMYRKIFAQRVAAQSKDSNEIKSINIINAAMNELEKSHTHMYYGLKLSAEPHALFAHLLTEQHHIMQGVREIEKDLKSRSNVGELQELATKANEFDKQLNDLIPEGGGQEDDE